MKTSNVKANCRIGKSGPPPHTVFVMCGIVMGERIHVGGVTHQNTMEPVFNYQGPCNGHSCKGWLAVTDRACAWLESIAARKASDEPMRGAL